jgi:hypothetical protein
MTDVKVESNEVNGVDMSDVFEDVRRNRWDDLGRLGMFLGLGGGVMMGSVPLADYTKIPELGVVGWWLALMFFMAAASHVLRRVLFPYIDLKKVAAKAVESAVGAGLVFLGVCFVIGCMMLPGKARAAESTLPANAIKYAPALVSETKRFWPEFQPISLFAGQVEKESCTSLKSQRCWTPYAELKTTRERGVGFGQITVVPGRFDALQEMVDANPVALKGWAWNTPSLYDPELQLRALVLKNKTNWNRITGMATNQDRVDAMLIAYNGGLGNVVTSRRMCAATPGCDSTRWRGHAEKTSRLSKVVMTGYGKSFHDINRGYPGDVELRAVKYRILVDKT